MAASLPDEVWARHANPWSGATRFAISPALVYGLYRRNWRLVATAVAFTVVNPILFPAPERTDAWLSRVVLGEQAWLADGNPTMGTGYPEVFNTVNVPVFLYALYAAYDRRPLGTVVATAASMALKLLFVREMARYYDETRG